MAVIFILALGLWAHADDYTWMRAPADIAVYKTPTAGAQPVYTVGVDERMQIGSRTNGYRRVLVYRGSRWRTGYVSIDDLERMGSVSFGEWGLGFSFFHSSLTQAGRTFKTEDEVQYVTSDYKGSSSFPALVAQVGRNSFWRFLLIPRTTDYSGAATSSVSGSAQKKISLRHSMVSAALQKGWTAKWFRPLYWVLGLEVARAMKTELTFDGLNVPTTGVNNPLYVIPHTVVGMQFNLVGNLLFNVEGRFSAVPNQSPLVYGWEFSSSLLYWDF